MKTCRVNSCASKPHARGYCNTHYGRWREGKDIETPVREKYENPQCLFKNCTKPRKTKGYCSGHYEQLRTGKSLTPLETRLHFENDDEKFEYFFNPGSKEDCWIWGGGLSNAGYGIIIWREKPWLAHRLSYYKNNGGIPEGMEIDHQCRNRSCVNPDHLKAVTRKQNRENLGLHPLNTSGYRGVSSSRGKWYAKVTHNRKQYSKGPFDTPEQANEEAVRMRMQFFDNNVEDRKQNANSD